VPDRLAWTDEPPRHEVPIPGITRFV
jgi:hypothetical protein